MLPSLRPLGPGPGTGLKRGYRPAEVDGFLARAADALHVRKPPLRSRRYDEDHVDDLLDAIGHGLRAGPGSVSSTTTELNGRPRDG